MMSDHCSAALLGRFLPRLYGCAATCSLFFVLFDGFVCVFCMAVGVEPVLQSPGGLGECSILGQYGGVGQDIFGAVFPCFCVALPRPELLRACAV